jgi:hypothetical protein
MSSVSRCGASSVSLDRLVLDVAHIRRDNLVNRKKGVNRKKRRHSPVVNRGRACACCAHNSTSEPRAHTGQHPPPSHLSHLRAPCGVATYHHQRCAGLLAMPMCVLRTVELRRYREKNAPSHRRCLTTLKTTQFTPSAFEAIRRPYRVV